MPYHHRYGEEHLSSSVADGGVANYEAEVHHENVSSGLVHGSVDGIRVWHGQCELQQLS